MATAVQCQHCGQRYAVREDLLGKKMKCKACGQTTVLVAAAAPVKAAVPNLKPAASARPAATKPAAARRPKTAAAAVPAQRTAQAAPKTRSPAASAPRATTATQGHAPAVAAAMPTDDPLFAPSGNMLDLLGDAALPPATAAPLTSSVVLKPSAPAPVAKPKAKKKKKKRSGEKSENPQVLLRMAGGACVVLLGLGAIGMGIYALVGDEDNINPFRFVRWVIFGVGLIGTGLKFIVG